MRLFNSSCDREKNKPSCHCEGTEAIPFPSNNTFEMLWSVLPFVRNDTSAYDVSSSQLKLFITGITTLSALFLSFAAGFSQDAQGIWVQHVGDDTKLPAWKASWIWLGEDQEADVMLARRTFTLEEVGQSARLRITASSQYQLYVNGKYVARGPSRSAPHHKSFDIWEIKSLLNKGRNILAVRVHKQKNKHSYHFTGRAGLLVQLENSLKDKTSIISSDASWKVSIDPSWDNEAPVINRFQMVVNDRVDFRKYLRGWEKLDFDDGTWESATPLMRKTGWPSVQKNATAHTLTPPWTTLLPRDVPYLNEQVLRAKKMIQIGPIAESSMDTGIALEESAQDLSSQKYPIKLDGTATLWVPAAKTAAFHLLDFGKVVNGMTQLSIKGPPGTKVDVYTSPFIVDQIFNPKVVFSDFHDQLILSGEIDKWEATYFKPTRFLGIVVQRREEPVMLYEAGIRQISYPFHSQGMMRSSDAPWVEQYMEASAKTLDVCTTDAYTDNYRERRQYAQTGYYAGLGNYWTFADHFLQRRYLIQVAQEQEANGMMPAYAPLGKDDFMIILDSNCLWLRSLRNFFLYSGDEKTSRDLLPAARKLMHLLESFTNELGMLDNPPYPYWLDHAKIDRRGANLNLNGHFLGALEDFADLLEWLGEEGAADYRNKAQHLRKALGTHLWDKEKGLFADAWIEGTRSTQFSEHGNAMALALNIASESQAKSVAEKLLENDSLNYVNRASGMTMVTPAMSYFLHKGLAEYGYVDESFALFRKRFDKMLAPNTNGTLWEEWWLDGTGRSGKLVKTSRSDAQTESAFPPALFAEYLLGLDPVKPGLAEVHISRPQSRLAQIEAHVPSPHGLLEVKWLFENKGGELIVEVPKGMELILDLASLGIKNGKRISVDGKKISLTLPEKSQLPLQYGSHRIKF